MFEGTFNPMECKLTCPKLVPCCSAIFSRSYWFFFSLESSNLKELALVNQLYKTFFSDCLKRLVFSVVRKPDHKLEASRFHLLPSSLESGTTQFSTSPTQRTNSHSESRDRRAPAENSATSTDGIV